MTFNTSRVILLKRHASPIERKLIRALRALELDGEWGQEGALILKEIGVKEDHLYSFNRLMKFLLLETPSFALLGPQSPFITRDELALLGALGDTVNRKAGPEFIFNRMGYVSLKTLLEACGLALRIGNVQLKARFSHGLGQLDSAGEVRLHSGKSNLPFRPIRVGSITAPTPLTRRVTVSGVSLFDIQIAHPAQWIKIFLPRDDFDPIGRAYTVLDFNPKLRQLTFDVNLNQSGPMSKWASTACIGDQLLLAGPKGGFNDPAKNKSWMLLAADETGFSAVRAIVSSLPNEIPIHAFIELSNEQEKQDLPLRENLSVHWVYRENKLGFTAGLAETIKACELPRTCGGAWIAGEASAIRDIRTHLVKERGFQVSNVQATGYWKQGVNDHKDLALIS